MHDLEILKNGGYKGAGLTQFKLTGLLELFPAEILELGETLEQLDLSGTGLSSLPANIGSALPNLKAAFFSDCEFTVFPKELASCPKLETVDFRNNGMEEIPSDAFPPRLRCLILTNNRFTSLPSSIGRYTHLQKCLLSGNRLTDLPASMAECKKLALLRLSSNNLTTLPSWLFTLPELAFLSFASNPCASPAANGTAPSTPFGLASIPWSDLQLEEEETTPGTAIGTPALWHQSPHYAEDVAVKLFRGDLPTINGSPADELATFLASGAHESLLTLLGRIHSHPSEDDPAAHFHGGLVMQRVPEGYSPLGQPPSLDTCTRDRLGHDEDSSAMEMDAATALSMLTGLAGAAAHLHARGISHGELCAHSVLASREDAHALLGDFGAATDYGRGPMRNCEGVEKVEVLAFGLLVEDVLGLVARGDGLGEGEGEEGKDERSEWIRKGLGELRGRCVNPAVGERPGFEEVVEVLEALMGWRGMMRIPDVGRS